MTSPPLRVFFSYDDRDAGHVEELLKHLSFVKDEYSLEYWYRGQLNAGDDWREMADVQLEQADIVVVAVTPDFFVSARCRDVELTRALARQATDATHVLPVIVRPAQWQSSPLGHLEPLPRGGKPVSTWTNPDEAWLDVARGLQRIVAEKREAVRLVSENKGLREAVDRLTRSERELTDHCGALLQELNRLRGGAVSSSGSQRSTDAVTELTSKLGQMHSEQAAQRQLVDRLGEQRQAQQTEIAKLRDELRASQRTIEALTAKTMVRAEIVVSGAQVDEDKKHEICWLFRVWNLGDGPIRLLSADTNWRLVPQHESATAAADIFPAPDPREFTGSPILQPGAFSDVYEVRFDTTTLGKPGGDLWFDVIRPAIRLHFEGVRVDLRTSVLRVLEHGTEIV